MNTPLSSPSCFSPKHLVVREDHLPTVHDVSALVSVVAAGVGRVVG